MRWRLGHCADLFHDRVGGGVGGLEVLVDGLHSGLECGDVHILDQLDAVLVHSLVQNLVLELLPSVLVLLGSGLGALGHDGLLLIGELVPHAGSDDHHIGDAGVLVEAVVLGHVAVIAQCGARITTFRISISSIKYQSPIILCLLGVVSIIAYLSEK